MDVGYRIAIRGTVQGVGFRPWVWRLAHEEGIRGRVRNDSSGVTIEAFGPEPALSKFMTRLRLTPPAAAEIRDFDFEMVDDEQVTGFSIEASREASERSVSIPADLATCPDCEREIFDPQNRRYRYAFTNCTNCGPRFTIAQDVPYDRASTTMSRFPMCADCAAEYGNPADRRFHAQPNACHVCGPQLCVRREGNLVAGDAIALAAQALDIGEVVAIKGIGGYHLACDATSSRAVSKLRERKHRDYKPFAVMVRDLAAARELADISDAEAELLQSIERPIVLLRKCTTSAVAEETAPDTPLIGLFLPYSPLHLLLLDAVKRPLVMTSGNVADEPIASKDDDAAKRLTSIADLVVSHDREIETRTDDSVARVIAGGPVVMRRSRGWVPRSIRLKSRLKAPVLACGADLKNSFCIGVDDRLYLGPHVGDLENVDILSAYEEAIEKLQRFVRVTPEIIACDLHPRYFSTAYAQRRPERKVAVQHHHAHIAAVMSEHDLDGPVLGFAWDGTGHGTDGTAWGGELLLASRNSFERIATFRPIALAGGDQAVRQVWRQALALLLDAFDGNPPLHRIPLFSRVAAGDVHVVRQMIVRDIHLTPAHGVGRYFDAFGSLFLNRPVSRYEGEVAVAWNVTSDGPADPYTFTIDVVTKPWQLDLRTAVRQALEDSWNGRSAHAISARFHATLVAGALELARLAAREYGKLPIALGGGCFQNPLLVERFIAGSNDPDQIFINRAIPPGDGGIAAGQALVASATE